MSDDVARAVGAGGSTVEIAGKQCQVRPLSIKELTEVERECLRIYKRHYMEDFAANSEFLPKTDRVDAIRSELVRTSGWDKSDLPARYAHDSNRIELTDGLRSWLTEYYGEDVVAPPVPDAAVGEDENPAPAAGSSNGVPDALRDSRFRLLAATALDTGGYTPDEYERETGKSAPRIPVDYMSWWITGSFDGMVTFVWFCFKDQGVTKDEVAGELGRNRTLAAELSREIESLSVPAAGNG